MSAGRKSSTHRQKNARGIRRVKGQPRERKLPRAGRVHGDVPDPNLRLTRRDKVAGEWFARLVALQARLRGPGGCPWDREQTHESLRKFLVEETYETLDAMDSGDPHKFSSEMGDLLLQIIFHSILAEETDSFTISDVIESVYTKMVRRHPHVFGTTKARTSADVLKSWEQLKAAERAEEKASSPSSSVTGRATKPESVLAGVPHSLPAVLEAYQLTRRASHVGFDWNSLAGILEKLDEEKRELVGVASEQAPVASANARSSGVTTGKDAGVVQSARARSRLLEEETGDLLFTVVNVARFLGVDPEIALKKANSKFKRRFEWMEAAAAAEGQRFADVPRERMEELWNESKLKDEPLQPRFPPAK
ncbi:MAG TPA: nucleoside triphosphate pyrophosphohydrolase [Candidatus Acidoferrum sp.]|nr:nucleoside triphosphate pyrophosphohydrolase [Candidatus Acidoferrum sp.]